MPELPEVETTRRGIAPHVVGRRIIDLVVRESRLRWPVPSDLQRHLRGRNIIGVNRRGKYLILQTDGGAIILHLGMSGSLHLLSPDTPAQRHDHLDILLSGDWCLRFRDPRRFGAVFWTERDPAMHERLIDLGPEPLQEGFDGHYLHDRAKNRKIAIKTFIMDSRIVAGIGNIYACESLFSAGIHPLRPAGRISRTRYEALASAIRDTLCRAIAAGGTTLRDFLSSDGRPGYFHQQLQVYGRAGRPCLRCQTPIRQLRQARRSTFYCCRCQT